MSVNPLAPQIDNSRVHVQHFKTNRSDQCCHSVQKDKIQTIVRSKPDWADMTSYPNRPELLETRKSGLRRRWLFLDGSLSLTFLCSQLQVVLITIIYRRIPVVVLLHSRLKGSSDSLIKSFYQDGFRCITFPSTTTFLFVPLQPFHLTSIVRQSKITRVAKCYDDCSSFVQATVTKLVDFGFWCLLRKKPPGFLRRF